MDFNLNENQKMLQKTARDFLARECPKSLVRSMEQDEKGYLPDLWLKISNMGWTGLAIPEKYGGSAANFLDLCVLLEETGRACLPGPFFATVVLGAMTLLEAGNEEQKSNYLPRIAKGELLFTLALLESEAEFSADCVYLNAAINGETYHLNGTKLFVPDAQVADYIICVARTDSSATAERGISLFLVDSKNPGISTTPLKTIAGDKQCEVVFNNVRIPLNDLLGQCNHGWTNVEQVLEKATVARCAEMVGGAQAILDIAVNYAKERIQFEQFIGFFQAIQHHCANMLIDVEALRYITYRAAWLVSEGMPCSREIAMAKAWASEAYRRVASLGVQIHGGIGCTSEHDAQLYYRRAAAAEIAFGDSEYHQEIVANHLAL